MRNLLLLLVFVWGIVSCSTNSKKDFADKNDYILNGAVEDRKLRSDLKTFYVYVDTTCKPIKEFDSEKLGDDLGTALSKLGFVRSFEEEKAYLYLRLACVDWTDEILKQGSYTKSDLTSGWESKAIVDGYKVKLSESNSKLDIQYKIEKTTPEARIWIVQLGLFYAVRDLGYEPLYHAVLKYSTDSHLVDVIPHATSNMKGHILTIQNKIVSPEKDAKPVCWYNAGFRYNLAEFVKTKKLVIDMTVPNSPPAKAGLSSNDEVVSINGNNPLSYAVVSKASEISYTQKPVKIKFIRKGRVKTTLMKPERLCAK